MKVEAGAVQQTRSDAFIRDGLQLDIFEADVVLGIARCFGDWN
jgi:hypothetical protein